MENWRTVDLLWRIFESTGAIWAYLAYRRPRFRGFVTEISLN